MRLSFILLTEADRSTYRWYPQAGLGERLLRQVESTDNGSRTINTINANLSTTGSPVKLPRKRTKTRCA